MKKSKAIYVAVAPLALLLIAGTGAHFVPMLLGDDKDDTDVPPALRPRMVTPVPAPEPTPDPGVDKKTQAELEKTVAGQISAMRTNKFGQALSFSVPYFRSSVSAEEFENTIRTRYPALLSAVQWTFQPARGTPSSATVPVLVSDEDGAKTAYLYILNRINGRWFVSNCTPVGPPSSAIADLERAGVRPRAQ